MNFDIDDAEHKALKTFIETKKALLIANSSNMRVTIRTFAKTVGLPPANIFLVNEFDKALSVIKEHQPEIIVTEFELGKRKGHELLKEFRIHQPELNNTLAILMVEADFPVYKVKAREYDVDILQEKPVTLELLIKNLLKAAKTKIKPSPADKMKDMIRKLNNNEDYEKIIPLATKLKVEFPKDVFVQYMLAKAYMKTDQQDIGFNTLEKALKIDEKDYNLNECLLEYFYEQEKYSNCYQFLTTLLENHPFDPNKIPQVTKILVANQKYADIVKYCDKLINWENFDNMDLGSMSGDHQNLVEDIHSIISTALIVGSRYLVKTNMQLAVEALLKAVRLSEGKISLLCKICEILGQLNKLDKAAEVLEKIPYKEYTPGVKEIKLRLMESDGGEPGQILSYGLTLIEAGIKTEKIYEIILRKSLHVGRRQEALENILYDATTLFPEKEVFFKSIIGKPA